MNDDRTPDEELTPAEERLLTLLTLLRAEAPRSDRAITDAVIRTARWQVVALGVFRAVGGFATAGVDTLASILGIRAGSGGK